MSTQTETFLRVSIGVSKDREVQLITALLDVVDILYYVPEATRELTREQAIELARVADYIQARLVADANKALSNV